MTSYETIGAEAVSEWEAGSRLVTWPETSVGDARVWVTGDQDTKGNVNRAVCLYANVAVLTPGQARKLAATLIDAANVASPLRAQPVAAHPPRRRGRSRCRHCGVWNLQGLHWCDGCGHSLPRP